MSAEDVLRPISRGGRRPVMTDVARAAGVSHQTVSRVLNGHGSVRLSTRRRVLDAIRDLDYRPNSAARALATSRSHTLGVVTFDTTLFGPASTVYGIERAARRAGYFVSIASARSLDCAAVSEALDRLREQAVDGIIVIAPRASVLEALGRLPKELAVVAVSTSESVHAPAVVVDNSRGAERATRFLLDLGHGTVHHIAGPAGWSEAQARLTGWRRALESADVPPPPPAVGDWTARSGYELGRALLVDPAVTAVFAGNDDMALGLLRAVREAGRSAPEDLSVVGFDDTPQAAYFAPPLTTLRQDFGELGRRSLETLLHRMHGTAPGATTLLEPELIVRDSAAPPGRPVTASGWRSSDAR